ncbi:mRNA 3'-end processing factor [Halobaculum sp. MBLA0143]|uniref:mRNA 3'-end processing factor n=1 Tax=Halobaculum sp. MBLA0143 TaxID=3079933 RepID=UPI00352444C9
MTDTAGTGVSLRDGVRIDLSDGTRVVADATDPEGDAVVVTHAHGDHLPDDPPATAVCSAATADLAAVRRDGRPTSTATIPGDGSVELLDAGHVAGSRALLVTDPDGTRYCYTGDVSVRDRLYLDGFEPPEADVLVVEATYGEPGFVFPPQSELEGEIVDFFEDTTDRPVLAFGYALGRAQELQLLAERAGRSVTVSDAIADLDAVVADHVDATFSADRYDDLDEIGPGDVVVLPSGLAGSDWVDRLCDRTDALAAGFSGWAIDDSFQYRGGYDETFVLTDHCDFRELVELVEAVDPERVYTTHGSTDTLATELTTRGFDARALVADQHTLGEFG